jgi:uncharacterized protein YigE (DUF2233 family)
LASPARPIHICLRLGYIDGVIPLLLIFPSNAGGPTVSETVYNGASYTTVEMDPQTHPIHLVGEDPALHDFRSASASAIVKDWKPQVLMNAGMFHSDGASVGLHIEDGRQWKPLNESEGEGDFFLKPNGVFWVDREGRAFVDSVSGHAATDRSPLLATQSGPLPISLLMRDKLQCTDALYLDGTISALQAEGRDDWKKGAVLVGILIAGESSPVPQP